MSAMKTKRLIGVILGAVAAIAGCASVTEDGAESGDQAQTERRTEQEDDFVVLDRMGRPEMTNVTIGPGMKEIGKDPTKPESEGLIAELAATTVVVSPHLKAYNRQNVFHPKKGEREHARRLLSAGIRAIDTIGLIGDHQDWQPSEIALITDILSEDALVVDISKPCTIDTQSFFDIEREELVRRGGTSTDPARPVEHETCGGRTLNDDIIDDVLTMWVHKSFDFSTRSSPRRVTDRLDKPTLVDGNTTSTFPYLGEPHADFKK